MENKIIITNIPNKDYDAFHKRVFGEPAKKGNGMVNDSEVDDIYHFVCNRRMLG